MAARREREADPDATATAAAIAAPAVVRPPAAPGLQDPAAVLALSGTAGNGAVARALQRKPKAKPKPAALPDYATAREQRSDFLTGMYGPQEYRAPTGLGGFTAMWAPMGGTVLSIQLSGGVQFREGMTMQGNVVVAAEPSAGARSAAAAMNRMNAADRQAAFAKWRWDAASKASFLRDFEKTIVQTWSPPGEQYWFHCSEAYWEDIGVSPRVSVSVHEGAQGSADHMKVVAFKTPDDFNSDVADVSSGEHGPHDNTMRVSSGQLKTPAGGPITKGLGFKRGTADLIPASRTVLADLAAQLAKTGDDVTISVCGEAADASIKGRRATTVGQALIAGGVSASSLKAGPSIGDGDYGELRFGVSSPQNTIAHEAGHMFGLDDEYAGGRNHYVKGSGTKHSAMAAHQGFGPITHANTQEIMSEGGHVGGQAMITFLDALQKITRKRWAHGPPIPVVAPADGGGGKTASADDDPDTAPAGPAPEPGPVPAAPA